jgi:MGT family glycosyltransferase
MKSGEFGTVLKVLGRALPWMGQYRQIKRQLQQTYSLTIPGIYTVLNWPGDLNIIYTADKIHPGAAALQERLDEQYIFVGPPMDQDTSDVPFPFAELDPDRPLIYISLGTVFSNNPTFFRQCIEAFKNQDYQVVMSLGRRLSVEALGKIPENFIVRSYVPQLAVLQRSDLYITHSGVNSTHQALYFGVPLLLVPQQLEQAAVAVRLAELGAGLMLRKPTAAKLQTMASRLLNDGAYRSQAEALSVALKDAGGVTRAVDEIESFVSARAT